MPNTSPTPSEPAWTRPQKTLFRFVFIYFLLQAIPFDWRFYQNLLSIDWGAYYYRDLFNLARYAPHFFGPADTFINWAAIAFIALVGTIVWTIRDQKRINYDQLYYWLRVIVRYRLAVAVLAYGFIKLFPMQAPLPSLSNLNTPYGEFTAWSFFRLVWALLLHTNPSWALSRFWGLSCCSIAKQPSLVR